MIGNSLMSKFIFFKLPGEKGDAYRFSTDLEKIGLQWDVTIQNGTYVEVISEPLEITRPSYGTISVLKIRANIMPDYHTVIKEFWVPAYCVLEIEENETPSSQLRN